MLCSQSAKQQLKFNRKNSGTWTVNYLGKKHRINWFSSHFSIDWTAWAVKIAGQQIQLVKYGTSLSRQTCFGGQSLVALFFCFTACFPALMPNPKMCCWVHFVTIQKICLPTTSEFSIKLWALFIFIKVSFLSFKVHLPNHLCCSSASLTV